MPTLPKTMRAAALDRFGGPNVLKIQTLPVPPVGRRDLLSDAAKAHRRLGKGHVLGKIVLRVR